MRNTTLSLLAVATLLSLGGNLAAQNDDCTGAIFVTQGPNGPFSNAGSTTSAPAWPCALGGNDVWFSYTSPGSGSLTADLCGSGFDTAIELFDGNQGCGNLTSLGCNDDSCGLQSSLTVSVNPGDTIFIRVGGFNSQTGTFTLNINGPAGSGTVATVSSYGTGCVARAGSFYEMIPAATFDLSNTSMTLLRLSPGYLALPLGNYQAPSANAVSLGLGDDSEITQALTTAFPYDGGTTNALTICSNGFVSVATGNGTAYTPDVQTMLGAPVTAWWMHHDFNPSIAGGGTVKFEEIGTVAYVTWDGVWDYGGTSAANASTFQMQFDSSNGTVTYVWQTMSLLAGSTLTDFLVGYSPGGASMDPGPRDISVTLPGTFTVLGNDVQALALAASARPIVGNLINLNTRNIGTTAPFGAVALGFTNPGLDLTGFGMAGCTQYTDNLAVLLFLPLGSTTNSFPFAVPNALGVTVLAQSFVYDPASGLTQLGATASNALSLFIGSI